MLRSHHLPDQRGTSLARILSPPWNAENAAHGSSAPREIRFGALTYLMLGEIAVLNGLAPAARAAAASGATRAEGEAMRLVGAGAWALVVEDDADTRGAIAGTLEDAGYLVADAPDGVAALEVMRASPYPLIVLLDYWMPRADGAYVLRQVAEEDALAQRHVFIVVTATPELLPPAFAALLSRLEIPVLAKPFAVDDLLAAVARASRRIRHRSP
jgi:CheY-like chemotaxis protein